MTKWVIFSPVFRVEFSKTFLNPVLGIELSADSLYPGFMLHGTYRVSGAEPRLLRGIVKVLHLSHILPYNNNHNAISIIP
jgi:hypothetical protein